MKIRLVTTLALIFLILVVVLATLVYTGVVQAPMGRIAENLGILRTSRVASSQLILRQLRDVLSFHSVEYVYRSVFPHDYYPEGVNLNQVLNRLSLNNRPAAEILSPEELDYWEAYNLANDVGLRASRDEFVVVTIRARGGYELEGTVLDSPEQRDSAAPPTSVAGGAFSETEVRGPGDTSIRVLTIRLPEPEVVDIVVEDVNPETYRYPEVGLHPEGWQQVAAFVSRRVAARTVEEGILDRTRENTEGFLRSLFEEAGYDRVEFR
ncbi:MAG: hypothetical protein ACLFPV_13030 [Spirochaetaceae bacterium]